MVDGNKLVCLEISLLSLLAVYEYIAEVSIKVQKPYIQNSDLMNLFGIKNVRGKVLDGSKVFCKDLKGTNFGKRPARKLLTVSRHLSRLNA